MPFSDTRDLQRLLEMSDDRFLKLVERVDSTSLRTPDPEPPKVPNKERTEPRHAGTMFEQQREYLKRMTEEGVI